MAVWLIRSRNDEDENAALEVGLALIGFTSVGNLATARNLKEFQQFCERALAGKSPTSVVRMVAQLWAFRGRIKQDDLVLMPRQVRGSVAVGRITGPYEYRDGLPGGARHVRAVEWLRRALPRSLFDEDLLLSLSAAASVASIRRRNGESRVRVMAGLDATAGIGGAVLDSEDILDEDCGTHLEENARDQLRSRLERHFPGVELARLVEAVLQAQGYRTHRRAPDAGGAVTILAGRGVMGLERPRVCVQVHTSALPQSADAVKDFQASVQNHDADQGLMVAWRGFHGVAVAESRQRYFHLRLWDDEDLMDAVMDVYEGLPVAIQASLALRKIWIPIPEED
jgi:restriction system protein